MFFEFGHKSIPYSAKGRDGGIDGQMINEAESWRFQYKFKSTPASVAFSSLKSDLQKEIVKLNPDVTHYVLITNVELLPSWVKQIQNLWNELTDGTVNFQIWEGAKLNTLVVANPLIRLWLNEGFTTSQLLYFRDYFFQQTKSAPLEPSSLNNHYINDENLQNKLLDFVRSDKVMFGLVGEAGLGKTRAVLEFFNNLENIESEKWVLLVLNSRNINYDGIKNALSSNLHHCILIDDGHTFDKNTIADLFAIAFRSDNKIKLILTSRAKDDLNFLIKEIYQHALITHELLPLTSSQSKELILHYLGNSRIRAYVDDLVQFSYGKPIIIVAMLNALNNGENIAGIKNSSFIKNYVSNYIREISAEISVEYNFPIAKILDVISILALTEPVNIRHEEEVNQIASVTGFKNEDIITIYNYLIEKRIVDGNSTISIKPDLYSDIILSRIIVETLSKWIKHFDTKIKNMLINLSSSINDSEVKTILLAFSKVYLDSIDVISDRFQFLDLSSTILQIGGYFPQVTKSLVLKYIKRIDTPANTFSKELIESSNKQIPANSISNIAIAEIVKHLSLLLLNRTNFDFVFDAVFEIQKRYDIAIVLKSIYQFGKIDFYDGFTMQRQSHFLDRLNEKQDFTENEISLNVQILSLYLKLEFMINELSYDRLSVNMSTFKVPENKNVVCVRERSVEYLFYFFKYTNASELRQDILKNILDIPREIFSNYRKAPAYDGKEEIEKVLLFLLEGLPEFTIIERNIVQEQLKYYELWDIKDQYSQLLGQLFEELTPKSLTERLISILSRERFFNKRKSYDEVRDDVALKIKELISESTPAAIANALIEAHQIKGNKLNSLFKFTQEIIQNDIEFLSVFYNQLAKDKSLFDRIAPDLLRAIRNKDSQDFLYSSMIDKLLNSEINSGEKVFLQIFSSLVGNEDQKISESEIVIIKKIINSRNEDIGYAIAELIPSLVTHDYFLGRSIAVDFFKYCSQSNAEYTFMYLNRLHMYSIAKELLLDHSYQFSISYDIEITINMILRNEGTDILIKYFDERFNNFIKTLSDKGIYGSVQFVPNHCSGLFENIEGLHEEVFSKALDWFLTHEGQRVLYFARTIFSYLAASEEMPVLLQRVFEKKSIEYKTDFSVQNKLLIAIEEFTISEEKFIDLVLMIYEFGKDDNTENCDLDLFTSRAYYALTNRGVQIGTPGQPFTQDILLLEIFNKKIANYSEFSKVHHLLTSAIKTIQDNIDRDTDLDLRNEKWF
ncbi:hypothetical protein AR686_12515 [Chryseobacterium aquaticum subsp. greenlandense]|uniref:Uncharacterized protein n=1 Tax=Chryseobacterium aquaticum subsp. greenlandense TaxID=345663 RepID=A0A101CG45_9FLAO|nr:hypothetical protein AR686_12515 [Chryseobacterium aquaticum subsp. greenlandense]